jgi:hypothetical protein
MCEVRLIFGCPVYLEDGKPCPFAFCCKKLSDAEKNEKAEIKS